MFSVVHIQLHTEQNDRMLQCQWYSRRVTSYRYTYVRQRHSSTRYPVLRTTISAFITNEAYIRSDSPFLLLEIYDTRDFLLGLCITHKLRARDYDADRFIFIDV